MSKWFLPSSFMYLILSLSTKAIVFSGYWLVSSLAAVANNPTIPSPILACPSSRYHGIHWLIEIETYKWSRDFVSTAFIKTIFSPKEKITSCP